VMSAWPPTQAGQGCCDWLKVDDGKEAADA
jgi:hypothetical protein